MKEFLQLIMAGKDLAEEEAHTAMSEIASGHASEAETAGFLVALAMKGESVSEIVGMVRAMQDHMVSIDTAGTLLDTCGTGGDGAHTINVSTITAFVCAAAGVRVAKHGNRSVSSKCGSFDVLEALGAKIDLPPHQAKKCLESVGITCLFAPNYHPAMKHVVPVRKALGVRTVFNYLGPLLNPAHATHQLIGVSNGDMAHLLGEVAMELGLERAIVVHSSDGLDEISIAAPTTLHIFSKGKGQKIQIVTPEHVFSISDIAGGDPAENASHMRAILSGKGTEAQNLCIAMNAGAALLAAEVVSSFDEGKKRAFQILAEGMGIERLDQFIEMSNAL